MKRDYKSSISDDVQFFVGHEVEKTPAFGMLTLFVAGVHPTWEIEDILAKSAEPIKHVFFGANHSYSPVEYEEFKAWDDMIDHFLKKGYLCSLDIPISIAEQVLESPFVENNNFIPQLRVPIPYVKQWNYNTTVKIDDIGFNKTNPGVWVHSLHDLQSTSKFTNWREYANDEEI